MTAPPHVSTRASRLVELAALAGCMAIAMLVTWRLGAEVNWDLRNYHFYGPHLLLDGRFTRDIEPAGVQSYFNPLFDIPFYLGVKVWKLPAIAVSLAHAAFHGLALWLVYRLTRLLFDADYPRLAAAGAPLAAVTAALGSAYTIESGGTYGDATIAVFALTAVAGLAGSIGPDGAPSRRWVIGSGLLVGFATGAKPVAAMYAIGVFALVVMCGAGVRRRIVRTASFGIAALAGVIVADGYWMWLMREYNGSFFWPFLDSSFKSPYVQVATYLGNRFMPRNPSQWLFYPFYFLNEQNLVSETPFRDPRFAVGFVAVVLFCVVALVRLIRDGVAFRTIGELRLRAVVVFTIAAYVTWLRLSSIYRYALGIEVLVGLLLLGSLAYWLRSTLRTLAIVAPVCLAAIVFTSPPAMPRIPWAPTYFGVDEQALTRYADTTVLMVDMPNAYVVPFFPSSTSFVRLASNWSFAATPVMRARVQKRVEGLDRQRVYLLDFPQSEPQEKKRQLSLVGLLLDETRCQRVSSLFDSGRICGVVDVRAGLPPALAAAAPTVPATFEGYHDIANCNGIMGWAWDQARPTTPIEIDVYDGSMLLTRVTADQFRADLQNAGKGDGRHGFTLPTPSELRDGRTHTINMKYAGTLVGLNGVAQQIRCAAR